MDVAECMKSPVVCNGYSVFVDSESSPSKGTEPSWGFGQGATESEEGSSATWTDSSSVLTKVPTKDGQTDQSKGRGRAVSFEDGDEWEEFTGNRHKAALECSQSHPNDLSTGFVQGSAVPRPCSERQVLARAVFRTCFEVPDPVSTSDTRTSVSDESSKNEELISLEMNSVKNDRLALSENSVLHRLQEAACAGRDFSLHQNAIKDRLFLWTTSNIAASAGQNSSCSESSSSRSLTIDCCCEEFKWNDEIEDNINFSPDVLPGFFRNLPLVDPPVQLEFDHSKAVLGMSMLTMAELGMMKDEITSKIHRVSSEMVTALQRRDVLLLEASSKNKFIAALLKVQDRKHALEMGVGGVERTRGRSRSSVNLSWSKLMHRTTSEEAKTSDLLLHAVIPYQPKEDGSAVQSVTLLKQWTRILQAMLDGNPNLPKIISSYLQSEVMQNSDSLKLDEAPSSSDS